MKAVEQSSGARESEALEWAIDYFRDSDLKSRGNSALLDFAVAEDVWRNDQKALDGYITFRVNCVLAYTGPSAGQVRRRHGKPPWDLASSVRGLCKYAAILMDRGETLPELLRNFILKFLLDPNLLLKRVGKPGRKHGDLKLRDLFIAGAIEHIAETWKFPATRNVATESASAASIVRGALESGARIHMVEKAINKIWGEQRRFNDLRVWLLKPRRPKN